MSTRICPVCGADYLDWVETCSTCGVLLVVPAQAPDPLRLPVDQQVVYELGEWPLGMQASAAQVMAESGIPHGWDGTDLVVQLDHEASVDVLLEAVEAEQPGIVGADWLDDDEDAAGPPPRQPAGRSTRPTPRTRPSQDEADQDASRYGDDDATDELPDERRAGVRARRVARRRPGRALPPADRGRAPAPVGGRRRARGPGPRRGLRGGAPRRARVPRRPGVRGGGRPPTRRRSS